MCYNLLLIKNLIAFKLINLFSLLLALYTCIHSNNIIKILIFSNNVIVSLGHGRIIYSLFNANFMYINNKHLNLLFFILVIL